MATVLVRDRMSSPVLTAPPDTPLEKIVHMLVERAVSGVVIVDGSRIAGLVSSTDLVRQEARGGEGIARRTAKDVMSYPAVTVTPETPIADAARVLVSGMLHRVVVVEGEHPVGVLAARDLVADVKALADRRPISTLMTTDIQSVDLGDTIESAVEKIAGARVHALIVVDGDFPIGVFTQANALAARELPVELRKRPVEDVMSYETICQDRDTPIYRVAGYVDAMNVRRILVVHARRMVGIVSALDLVRPLAA